VRNLTREGKRGSSWIVQQKKEAPNVIIPEKHRLIFEHIGMINGNKTST
jgi:hypothetical protein